MTMKLNKKGFTLVELVVVIAVIVILSAILIPTFSGVTEKANAAARSEALAGAEKTVLVEYPDLDRMTLVYEYKGKYYQRKAEDNSWEETTLPTGAKQLVVATEATDGDKQLIAGATDSKLSESYENWVSEVSGTKYKLTDTFNTLKVYQK